MAPRDSSQVQHVVWVHDLGLLLEGRHGALDASSQIIIVRQGRNTVGLLVDGLHAVPEFEDEQLMATPFGTRSSLVSHFIRANQGQLLIQLLDLPALFARIFGNDAPTPAASAGLLGK